MSFRYIQHSKNKLHSLDHIPTHSNQVNNVATHSSAHIPREVDHEVEKILEKINLSRLNETKTEQARQLFS